MLRVASLFFVLFACGPRHRGEPHGPPIRAVTGETRGKTLFGKFCYKCHPNGTTGLGPAINNKPLPEIAIETQIRKGVGDMPSFDHSMLSDADVRAIADYVTELRQAPAAYANK
jgi:mono/diheme cytochrome c family protein